MIINHNLSAMNAQRMMGINSSNASKAMQKLSSGLRINSAADDAAGLAISEKMRAQINGLNQASSNAQDAISLIQTGEGALNETHSILQRMRELAVQSSTDTNTSDDRAKIQSEVDELAKEITRISNTTEFNTQNLLNGGMKTGNIGEDTFQIGANSNQSIQLSINAMDAYSLGVAGTTATATVSNAGTGNILATSTVDRTMGAGISNGKTLTISAADVAPAVGTTGDQTINAHTWNFSTSGNTTQLNGYTIKFGDNNAAVSTTVDTANKVITVQGDWDNNGTGAPAAMADVQSSINTALSGAGFTAQITIGGAGAVIGNIADLETAAAGGYAISGGSDGSLTAITINDGTTSQTVNVNDTDTSIKVSSGYYQGLNLNLTTGKTASGLVGIGTNPQVTIATSGSSAATFSNSALSAEATASAGIDVSTQTSANSAITVLDKAINTVSAERSKLGAYQNRLEHTIANLGTSSENLTSSESRIRDVDMAKEMSEYSKDNILSQAAQAMLAQANQQPQQVLQLLR